MSNRRKTPDPLRRAPQHREGRGRHREPPRGPGGLIAVPGQAGVRILAAGALGSAAAMSLSAGAASAATASGPVTAALTASVRPAPSPAPISGGNATFSVTNGQPSLSFNLKTPFGQTPNLTLPTVTPFQPTPLQFTLDPAGAINSDPVLRNLPAALAAQQAQQAQQALSSFVPPTFDILPSAPAAPAFGPSAPVPLFNLPGTSGALSPATPPASPGPVAPVPFTDISAASSPGLLPATPPSPDQASSLTAPVSSNTAPSLATPPLSVSGSISAAAGPIGGTAGLTCDNGGNCALTLGYLVGWGGSARLAVSPNPAPTTLNFDVGAQASGSLGPFGVTAGASGSLNNFSGINVFARGTNPVGQQFTVSGTVPPSVLAGVGLADSNAAAAEAGLPTIDQPIGPSTPNQQVAQAFDDLAGINSGGGISIAPGSRIVSFGAQTTAGLTVTIPLSVDYFNQVGQALGNAEMVLPVLPDPALTPAQRIDQGFSAISPGATSLTPAQQVDQGFSALSGNTPASVVQQDFAALAGSGTGAGGFNTLPGPFPVAPVTGQQAPIPYITDMTTPNGNVINPLTGTAPGGNAGGITRGITPADPAAPTAPAAPAPPAPAPTDQAPPAPADQAQPPAPGPQTQVDPAPVAPIVDAGTPVTGPDTTASSSPVVAAADPTAVSPAPAAPAPAPISAGLGAVGPVASTGGGGFSGGGFSGGGSG